MASNQTATEYRVLDAGGANVGAVAIYFLLPSNDRTNRPMLVLFGELPGVVPNRLGGSILPLGMRVSGGE